MHQELILPIKNWGELAQTPHQVHNLTDQLEGLPGVMKVMVSISAGYILLDLDGQQGDVRRVLRCLANNGVQHGQAMVTLSPDPTETNFPISKNT